MNKDVHIQDLRQALPYTLVNVETSSSDHLGAFSIPPLRMRQNLRAGAFARLIFVGKRRPRGERLWVKVAGQGLDRATSAPRYIGLLTSEPASFEDDELARGDTVVFGAEHVAECDVREP